MVWEHKCCSNLATNVGMQSKSRRKEKQWWKSRYNSEPVSCNNKDTNTYGQESPGWISLYKLFLIFFWKYTETAIFLEKLIGQWITDRNGRGIARDIKPYIYIFKTRQKIVTKLGQFTKLGPFSTFQLFKLSKLCYHFCRVLKIKIFFLISLEIPRSLRSVIHWPINFTKKF